MGIERTAKCACGQLQAVTTGEPGAVVACHCLECQRRTGAPLGVGAYYRPEQVTLRGDATKYSRPCDSGETLTSSFCPQCGTSLYWILDQDPDRIGIAVGAFADPQFPAPVRSVWEQSMHSWIRVDCVEQHFVRGRDS